MESLLKDFCEAFRQRHSVSVITAYAHAVGTVEKGVYRPGWPGLAVFSLYALFRGALLLNQNQGVEVVFGGSAMVAPLVLLLARLFRRKAVVQVHGLDIIYPNQLYQALCVRWLRRCDRVIANSGYTASLAKKKGARPEAIAVIPPGVHAERFVAEKTPGALERQLGLEKNRVILFVGRLAKRKGIVEFIRNCMNDIVTAIPDACLVVIGQNPTESLTHGDDVGSAIEATVSAMGLNNHVRMLGWMEGADLAKIYSLCHLIVLPVLPVTDDVEGFGIVLLEAAAAGKPAVATRVGGIPDAVEDGKSGILVEPADYAALSRATIKLLREEKVRVSLGEYGRKRVREHFGWEIVVRQYDEALSRAVEITN